MKAKRVRLLVVAICAGIAACMGACAGASRTPDAGGPRAAQPPYPILLTDDPERRAAALASWAALTREQGIDNAPAPELQPVTATIRSLPTFTTSALYLPKVGVGPLMNEEETRESLRRFIVAQNRLLGADPQQLSLVLRTDEADGTKRAQYQQRPFRYPLRGGYGMLEISFAPDRRILQINSTCIPEVERLQRAGAAAGIHAPQNTDEVIKRITGRTLTYTDTAGNTQSLTITAGEQINVGELIVYTRMHQSEPPALEFHLAWEIALAGTPNRTFYLDTITNEILGTS